MRPSIVISPIYCFLVLSYVQLFESRPSRSQSFICAGPGALDGHLGPCCPRPAPRQRTSLTSFFVTSILASIYYHLVQSFESRPPLSLPIICAGPHEHWTGTSGLVVLAPHLVNVYPKSTTRNRNPRNPRPHTRNLQRDTPSSKPEARSPKS